MKPAGSLDAFLAAPLQRFHEGGTFVAWCAAPDLVGMSSFGQRTPQESVSVIRVFSVMTNPALTAPIKVLLDYRRLEGVTPEAYAAIAGYLREMSGPFMARIGRVVMLLSPTQVGAAVAGTAAVTGYAPALSMVGSELEAKDALQHASTVAALQEMEALLAARHGQRDVLNGVRALLRLKPRGQSIALAASGLAVSTRTLQRELKAAGTTFTKELHAARAAYIAQALSHTEAKVESIAAAAGCSSPSQMAALFRRHYQMGPSEYRRTHAP